MYPGPADQAIDAGQVMLEKGEALEVRESICHRLIIRQLRQHVDRRGPLQGDVDTAVLASGGCIPQIAEDTRFAGLETHPVRLDLDHRLPDQQFVQIGFDLGLVGRVDHDHEAFLGTPIDDDVVEYVARRVEDVTVLGPPHGQLPDVIGGGGIEDAGRPAAGKLQHPHVGAIEQPGRLTDGPVLGCNRRVPQGHHIPGKRAHPLFARPLEVLVIEHARRRLGCGRLENELA